MSTTSTFNGAGDASGLQTGSGNQTSTANTIQFTLGSVVFSRFEVPEEFDIGHEIKHTIHDYISESGTPLRQVTAQGAFPLPTVWTGFLYNSTALSRMAVLDQMAVASQVVTFNYGSLQFDVLITNFKATIHHQYEVKYEITLVVIDNANGTGTVKDTGVSFDTGTQSFVDQSNAAVSNLQAADPDLPASLVSSLDDIATGITNCTPFKTASITDLQDLIDTINVGISELQAYNTPLQNTAVLEADLAKLNASLQALQGYGLLNENLLLLVGSPAETNQTVPGFTGSLYLLAAQYYPNSDAPTIAQLIATANSIPDLFCDTPTDISLPPVFS
jgi:hypothetical protein